MIAALVLRGVEGGSWDAIERTMTWQRYRALAQLLAPKSREARGGFAELVAYLGADPATGRGGVLR